MLFRSGNHDYGDYYNWESPEMKQKNHNDFIELNNYMGWQLLNNENTSISKGNDSIIIIGVENWGEGPFKNHADFAKAMEGVNQDNFMILLSHNPKHWKAEVINETMTDLTLSGHTHAMQTMFSFGPLNYSPAQWVYPEWSGLYTENNQHLYVNKGIGYVFIPWRIGAYPEITIFELKSSKD